MKGRRDEPQTIQNEFMNGLLKYLIGGGSTLTLLGYIWANVVAPVQANINAQNEVRYEEQRMTNETTRLQAELQTALLVRIANKVGIPTNEINIILKRK